MRESLAHSQLPDFIKLVSERGFKSIITTNDSNEDYIRYICNLADFAQNVASIETIVVFGFWNKDFETKHIGQLLSALLSGIKSQPNPENTPTGRLDLSGYFV